MLYTAMKHIALSGMGPQSRGVSGAFFSLENAMHDVGGGWYLNAAVASKGRFKQCDCNAAITDIMPSRDLIISNQALGSVVHGLQAAHIHVRRVIAQLAVHLQIMLMVFFLPFCQGTITVFA